jgi:malonate decarboxylase gamma subunit
MEWRELLDRLFGRNHGVENIGNLLWGMPELEGRRLAVIGTIDHAAIGVELALEQARLVLNVLRNHPGCPILLLVDTQGQRLKHRDELLGINRYMAHLGLTIELARRRGHLVIGLVYDQALSGGFITSGLMADACFATQNAQIHVMRLAAMARVTKLDPEYLAKLAESNPVFAPGVANYVGMGAIQRVWGDDLAAELKHALENTSSTDLRAAQGASRGGRKSAMSVIDRVANAAGGPSS